MNIATKATLGCVLAFLAIPVFATHTSLPTEASEDITPSDNINDAGFLTLITGDVFDNSNYENDANLPFFTKCNGENEVWCIDVYLEKNHGSIPITRMQCSKKSLVNGAETTHVVPCDFSNPSILELKQSFDNFAQKNLPKRNKSKLKHPKKEKSEKAPSLHELEDKINQGETDILLFSRCKGKKVARCLDVYVSNFNSLLVTRFQCKKLRLVDGVDKTTVVPCDFNDPLFLALHGKYERFLSASQLFLSSKSIHPENEDNIQVVTLKKFKKSKNSSQTGSLQEEPTASIAPQDNSETLKTLQHFPENSLDEEAGILPEEATVTIIPQEEPEAIKSLQHFPENSLEEEAGILAEEATATLVPQEEPETIKTVQHFPENSLEEEAGILPEEATVTLVPQEEPETIKTVQHFPENSLEEEAGILPEEATVTLVPQDEPETIKTVQHFPENSLEEEAGILPEEATVTLVPQEEPETIKTVQHFPENSLEEEAGILPEVATATLVSQEEPETIKTVRRFPENSLEEEAGILPEEATATLVPHEVPETIKTVQHFPENSLVEEAGTLPEEATATLVPQEEPESIKTVQRFPENSLEEVTGILPEVATISLVQKLEAESEKDKTHYKFCIEEVPEECMTITVDNSKDGNQVNKVSCNIKNGDGRESCTVLEQAVNAYFSYKPESPAEEKEHSKKGLSIEKSKKDGFLIYYVCLDKKCLQVRQKISTSFPVFHLKCFDQELEISCNFSDPVFSELKLNFESTTGYTISSTNEVLTHNLANIYPSYN